MSVLTRATVLLWTAMAAAAQVNFDNLPPGVAPPNWTRAQAVGGPVHMQVSRDPTAPSGRNVVDQRASGPHSAGFPLLYDKVVCRDGEVSVKFRIAPSRTDQSAGVIFRYQDPGNYYLLNFSVDQKLIHLVRMVNGQEESLALAGRDRGAGFHHDLRANQWYVAKVIFRGPRLQVLFGNRRLFEVQDSRLQAAGKAGVWTKGETEAFFDDFRIDKKS